MDKEGRALFGSFLHMQRPAALIVALDDPDKAFGDFLCAEGNILEAKILPPVVIGRNHHAFRHGLLQHTLEVADIVAATAGKQQNWGGTPIHHDLAIAGALLHDIGKIEEMRQENFVFEFSDEGSLPGHITLGTVYLVRKIVKVRKERRF